MPSFRIRNTFEVNTGRKPFVIAGEVVEAPIRIGMFIQFPWNSSITLTARIHRIEFARWQDGEDVCLCLDLEPDELEVWRGMELCGETIEVTENGSD
jgi:hypothetical protein